MKYENVLLGVSGGIAAYKAAELARLFVKQGATVRTILTKSALEFITPLTFESLTGNPSATEMFAPRSESAHEHIELARFCNLFIVAPATANVIAKFAHGIADDLLSTTALATTAQIVVAPAMNSVMWENAATKANVALLKERGIKFIGPSEGELACLEVGAGRMSEPADIIAGLAEL